jgi:hypothetical protein
MPTSDSPSEFSFAFYDLERGVTYDNAVVHHVARNLIDLIL